jgi:hypothetical protein
MPGEDQSTRTSSKGSFSSPNAHGSAVGLSNGKQELDSTHNRTSAIAFIVWLVAQLIAIAIGACHIQLWARAPEATEHLTLAIMLAIQAGTSALIFPHLLGTRTGTILAIASAWPMAELAAQLADAPSNILIRSELYVSFWLIALHFWAQNLPTLNAKIIGPALATLFAIGGPVLWYLRLEFSTTSPQPQLESFALFGPISGVISQTLASPSSAIWVELTCVFCVALLLSMGQARIARTCR